MGIYDTLAQLVVDKLLDEYNENDIVYELIELLEMIPNDDKYFKMALSEQIDILSDELGRCPYCGDELEVYEYDEIHSELDCCPVEHRSEIYCRNCDK